MSIELKSHVSRSRCSGRLKFAADLGRLGGPGIDRGTTGEMEKLPPHFFEWGRGQAMLLTPTFHAHA